MTTKNKILDVVVSYIKENPNLKDLTIAKIAQRAEIGKSTVYEHFSSKADIIEQTYNYLLYSYQQIFNVDIKAKDFKGAFIEQVSRILIVMKDASTIMHAIIHQHKDAFVNFGVEKTAKDIYVKLEKRFEEIFFLGIKESLVQPQTESKYQRNVVQAIISGLLFQYVGDEIKIEEQELFELIYQQTLRVIN